MPATAMGSVRIDLSAHGGGSILLRNFDIAGLDESDFVFQSTTTEQRETFELPQIHAFELDTPELEGLGGPDFWVSGAAGGEGLH